MITRIDVTDALKALDRLDLAKRCMDHVEWLDLIMLRMGNAVDDQNKERYESLDTARAVIHALMWRNLDIASKTLCQSYETDNAKITKKGNTND